MESHQEAEIRHLLHSNQHTQPVLPIIKQMEEQKGAAETPKLASATSSRKNSESSEPVKRSQRKRIPNKFYGYTSDVEMNQQNTSATTNPFKPIPPPNLTWRKEDLPATKNKNMDSGRSTCSASKKSSCWSLVPYQPSGFSLLTQTQMEQLPLDRKKPIGDGLRCAGQETDRTFEGTIPELCAFGGQGTTGYRRK